MKTRQKIVYYCDYCKKHLLVEKAMKQHEAECSYNPRNDYKCFHDCKYFGDFYCSKHGTLLRTRKSYRRVKLWGLLRGAKRMPVKCNHYEIKKEDIGIGKWETNMLPNGVIDEILFDIGLNEEETQDANS